MKKILVATGVFPPDIGGPATYSKLLSEKLPERGFCVRVVNFGSVVWLPKIFRHVIYFLKVLLGGMFSDVVYAQDPVSTGFPAMLAAKLLRKKFFLKIVGDYAWEQGVQRCGVVDLLDEFSHTYKGYPFLVWVLKQIQLRVALSADEIITPSEYLKRIIMNWGVPENKITVIYNGFNAPMITLNKEALRKKLGVEGCAVLSVGRLVPWKGFLMLIEIFPELAKQIPDLRLYIVGDGPDKELLKEKIAKLGLVDRVFLLGKLPQEKLFEYIKAVDLFALNTSYEGFSHQLLEVMAIGTPVITTTSGGNEEIIHDHANGILVPYNDKVLFSKAFRELYEDKELRDSFVWTAQEDIKKFSDDRMIDAFATMLA